MPYLDHDEVIKHMRGYVQSLWKLERVSHIWAANLLAVQEHGGKPAYIQDMKEAIDGAQIRLQEYEAARDLLDSRLRDAVHLIDYLGYSLDEAAAELEANRKAVSRWEKRGLLDIGLIYLQAAGVTSDWMHAPPRTRIK